jgi:hypothetical protein
VIGEIAAGGPIEAYASADEYRAIPDLLAPGRPLLPIGRHAGHHGPDGGPLYMDQDHGFRLLDHGPVNGQNRS